MALESIYKEYLCQLRNTYTDQKYKSQDNIDKYLLTFSSTFIALISAYFMKFNHDLLLWKPSMVFALILFIATIIITLLSFNFSSKIHNEEACCIQNCLNNDDTIYQTSESSMRLQSILKYLNWSSFGCFSTAFVSILCFVIRNIYN